MNLLKFFEQIDYLEHTRPKLSKNILIFVFILGVFLTLLIYKIPSFFLDPIKMLCLFVTVFILGLVVLYVILLTNKRLFKGAPFVRSSENKLPDILELAEVKPGEMVADLGSGDGTLVLEFAKKGAKSIGYEINPLLYIWSRLLIKKNNLEHTALVSKNSFWNVNFSDFDVITIYGIDYIMPELEKKLGKELKPGARIVCNTFKFPNWQPKKSKNDVHLYILEK
jgi:SAM-dependent methyltransferase